MLVTTQHTPQTSLNVLLLVVLLMPPTTTTTIDMVMRFLLLWPSMHNKRTLISTGFLRIAGSCRGAMYAGVSAVCLPTSWSAAHGQLIKPDTIVRPCQPIVRT